MSNIDKIFKEGLGSHEMAPDADVWSGLSKTLKSKEGKVVLPWYYNPKKAILGALLVSMLSFSVGFFYAQYNELAQETKGIAKDNTIAKDNRNFAAAFNNVRLETLSKANDAQQVANNYNETSFAINSGAHVNEKKLASRDNVTHKQLGSKTIHNISPLLTAVASLKGGTYKRLSNLLFINNEFANIPTAKINQDVAKSQFDKFRITLNAMATPTSSGFVEHFDEGTTVDIMVKESSSYQISGASLGFKYLMTKNFGFTTGLMFDKRTLSINGTRVGYDKSEESNLENRERVSGMSYTRTYSSDALLVPVGISLAGNKNVFGYHVDFGGFLSQTLSQSRSFTLSDEIWLPLANEWQTEVFSVQPSFGLYSSVGFDAYLGKNLGISIDAFIRKRFVPVLSYGQFENEVIRKGLQVGLFYSF